jgi:hypothetical protein
MKRIILTESEKQTILAQHFPSRISEETLEEQNLLNTIGSKLKGAAAGIGSAARNIVGKSKGGKVMENPKLANILAQMKNRTKFIREQITFFGKESTKLRSDLNVMAQNNPDYATEANALNDILGKYQVAMQNALEATAKFEQETIQYTTQSGTQPAPAPQPGGSAEPVAQTS